MSIQELKRSNNTTDMQDAISMVYFNNIHEYYPVKAVYIIKIDIGLIGKDIDVDILQALNIHDEYGRWLIEFLYGGDEEDINNILSKHQDALVKLVQIITNKLKVDIDISYDCDETTSYVLNKIIDSNSKNITIAEIFEME